METGQGLLAPSPHSQDGDRQLPVSLDAAIDRECDSADRESPQPRLRSQGLPAPIRQSRTVDRQLRESVAHNSISGPVASCPKGKPLADLSAAKGSPAPSPTTMGPAARRENSTDLYFWPETGKAPSPLQARGSSEPVLQDGHPVGLAASRRIAARSSP
jgi:hypothetical protein